MNESPISNERLWTPDPYATCVAEACDVALAGMSSFGGRFFRQIIAEFPEIRNELIFLRCRRKFHPDVELYSEEDEGVVAILDRKVGGFGLQIDPVTDCIVVWNETLRGEFADWGAGKRFVEDALQFIRKCLGGAS